MRDDIVPPKPPFLLDDLEVGKKDPRGRDVVDILWAVHDFKIYKTEWGISPFFADDDSINIEQRRIYLSMGADIAGFNHMIQTLRPITLGQTTLPQLPKRREAIIHHERELARCIAQVLTGDAEGARVALASLRDRLAAQIANRGRVIHLLINLALMASVWIIALLILDFGYQPRFGFEVKDIALAAVMGSAGALFSTAVGLKQMQIDPMVGRLMHWIYGGQRVLIGVMGAVFLYFGLKSGILDGLFQPLQGEVTAPATLDLHWLAFVSVLAGFTERLVPNLLDGRSRAAKPQPGGPPAPAPNI